MAITKFGKNMAIISALDDEPNDVGGLTAGELKAKFDEGGEALKSYLNETLVPVIDAEQAKVTALQGYSHTHANKTLLDTYQQTEANLSDAVAKKHTHANKEVLDSISAVTQTLGSDASKVPSESAVSKAIASSGNIPGGGTTGQVLVKNSDETHDIKWESVTAESVGAVKWPQEVVDSGSIKDWALKQKTPTSAAVSSAVSDMPYTGAYWFVRFDIEASSAWQKLVATEVNTYATYEIHRVNGTWGNWREIAFVDSVLPLTGGRLIGALELGNLNSGSNILHFIPWSDGSHIRNVIDSSNYSEIYMSNDAPNVSPIYSGYNNGSYFAYEFLHNGNAANFGYSRMVTGTYAGTGRNGNKYPNTLTPGFAPRAMMIWKLNGTDGEDCFAVFANGTNGVQFGSDSSGWAVGAMTATGWGSTSISWYRNLSSNETKLGYCQMNASGSTYAYIIWG